MPTNNAWNSNIPVSLAQGGTNATSMGTSTGIVKYDGTSLVTSTTAKIDSSNRTTNTSQPCFSAYLGTSVSNVTGDGTAYTVLFDTVAFDNGTNYATGTGLFTAPVTGRYLFTVTLNESGAVAAGATAVQVRIVATGITIQLLEFAPTAITFNFSGSQIISMTANDTAKVTLTCSGGTKTVGITGSASFGSVAIAVFSGHLIC